MSDEKKPVISAGVDKLAAAFKAAGIEFSDIKKGDTEATLTVKGFDEVLTKELEERGSSLEHAKIVNGLRDDVIPATGLIFEEANKVFKKNPSLERIVFEAEVLGKDTIKQVYKRTHETVAPKTEANPNPVPVVKHGHLITNFEVHAAATNRGNVKKVKNFLYEQAAAALG